MTTVRVYYSLSHSRWTAHQFNTLLTRLPGEMAGDVMQQRVKNDRYNGLCGKLLLRTALEETLGDVRLMDRSAYSSLHRPYIPSEPTVDFNISHSHDLVVCAIATSARVGIDCERIKPIDISCFTTQFNDREMWQIQNDARRHERFYYFWTKKESVIKGDGRGLYLNLMDLDVVGNAVTIDEETWHMTRLDIHSEYVSHLSCNTPPDKVKLIRCDFE